MLRVIIILAALFSFVVPTFAGTPRPVTRVGSGVPISRTHGRPVRIVPTTIKTHGVGNP